VIMPKWHSSEGALIRDYRPSDFEAIKKIHESTQIDYEMPELNSRLFLVKKVLELDGVVRAAAGMYVQLECYLWLDKTDWADPDQKMLAIKALDRESMEEAWLKGIDCAVLWLPPGMERFGTRLEDIGFTRDRDGWHTYSKPTRR
jgi:hypothetical protein